MLKSSTFKTYIILQYLNRLSPKRAYKQVIEDELNIDGGKHD